MPFRHIRSNGLSRKLYIVLCFADTMRRRLSASRDGARVLRFAPHGSFAPVRMVWVRAAPASAAAAGALVLRARRTGCFGLLIMRAARGGVRGTCRRATGTVRAGGRFSLYFADHRPCRHRRHNDDAKHDHKYINGSHIVIPCRLRPGCRPRCPPPQSRRRSPRRPPSRV